MTSTATLPAHRPSAVDPVKTAPTHKTKPKRDTSVDTAVGVLILLVVFSHAIGPLGDRPKEVLNQWLFMFHMPAFVFLSGYLTRRSSNWSPRLLALRLLVPFVIFQVIHLAAEPLETGQFSAPSPLIPAWTTWYLLSLFLWRLASPWLKRMPALLPVAIAVSLGAGLVPVIGQHLSLGRTLGFLPFFALGLLWRDHWFARIRTRGWRVLALGAFAFAGLVALVTEPLLSRTVYYMHEDYADVDLTNTQGLIVRAGVLLGGLVLTVAFMSLTGWTATWLAGIGAASLVVYLLHPIALYPIKGLGYSEALPELAWLAIIAAGTVGFGLIVTLPTWVRATRPLMDYRWWSERTANRSPNPRMGQRTLAMSEPPRSPSK